VHDFLEDLDGCGLRVDLVEESEDVVLEELLLVEGHGVVGGVVACEDVVLEGGNDHGEEVAVGRGDEVAEVGDEVRVVAGCHQLLLALLDGVGVEASL